MSAYVHQSGNDRSELVRILDTALSHRDRPSFERHFTDLMKQCRTTEDVREGARLEAATRMLEYEYGRLYDGAAVTVVASGERHRAQERLTATPPS
ncbi:MAG: hypothetical protein M3203_10960 [Actinomycetota bacterium]|nr:hypothetical protein [Actinomycetota bacterium]